MNPFLDRKSQNLALIKKGLQLVNIEIFIFVYFVRILPWLKRDYNYTTYQGQIYFDLGQNLALIKKGLQLS